MTEEEQKLYKNFKQAQVRQQILDAVREDLIGPRADGKPLTEDPSKTYISGVLFPSDAEYTIEEETYDNQEEDSPQSIQIMEDNSAAQETVYEETDDVQRKKFKKPSSLGVSFYLAADTSAIKVIAKWGTYTSKEFNEEVIVKNQETDEEETKVYKKNEFYREAKQEEIIINFNEKERNKRIPFPSNPRLFFYVISRITNKKYRMVTVYIQNCDKGGKSIPEWQNAMYQTELIVTGVNNESCFIAEYICRENELEDEYFYKSRPVFARGRQCAAEWENPDSLTNATLIKSSFIPSHEIAGVKADIDGFEEHAFSTYKLMFPANKEKTIIQLSNLVNNYDNWISNLPDTGCNQKKYEEIRIKCYNALNRMKAGIELISNNEIAYKAFTFMNTAMYWQKAITLYSNSRDSNKNINKIIKDENGAPKHLLEWRPFQIAFILLNLVGLTEKNGAPDSDRNIVDLLYFPTGGGKTEAYLGLIAYTVGLRRLSINTADGYERDGGVTVFLRYTLRLLTTQQRDRLLKLILAMDIIRKKAENSGTAIYGKIPISIGFWVGGQLTPNTFVDYTSDQEYKKNNFIKMVSKQLVRCPYCGEPLTSDNYIINPNDETVQIYCSNDNCLYSKAKGNPLPVYLVDTEIYHKCPTVIISTVDKFARLPWDEKVGALFGHVNRSCPQHGFIAVGEEHSGYHKGKSSSNKIEVTPCKPFYPPELIIQDELHLITGPLGTIYGGYETAIEYLCTVNGVKPKYIVSTATIKNAGEQVKTLYGREIMAQFPPSGTDIKDSFFMKEVDLPETKPANCSDEQIKQMIEKKQKPFREYAGVCVPGQSVKTTLIRLYAVILQKTFELAKNPEYEDYVDPYFTLIGYFNSIRELGGAVRLLEDDIVKRIDHIVDKYGYQNHRYLSGYDSKKEITSRIKSHEIAEILEHLAIPFDKELKYQNCYDVVIATNMIAVGMDVDRLGLMAVLGQPKQNAEYIQATSRVGRQSPGLIFSLYNPYRPRDLSNYENFMGFHTQMYRYVEGTTSTPFAARAIDRDMHALILALIRLTNEKTAKKATGILYIDDSVIESLKQNILERVKVVDYTAYDEAEIALDSFINTWKALAKATDKSLVYHVEYPKHNQQRLISRYGLEINGYNEKPTLNSMRDVEHSANIFLWEAK